MINRIAVQICLAAHCLLALSGCTTQNFDVTRTEMPTDACIDNPLYVQQSDPCRVWETTVDVAGQFFDRFNREQPVRQIGGILTKGRLVSYPQESPTLLEPWRLDAGGTDNRLENTLQTMRHWVDIQVVPAEQESGPDGTVGEIRGFWISVRVYEELEQSRGSSRQTAGADTLRYEDSIERVADPVGEVEIHEGWVPMGRNTMLEQKILSRLFEQLYRTPMGYAIPQAVRSQSPEKESQESSESLDLLIHGQSPRASRSAQYNQSGTDTGGRIRYKKEATDDGRFFLVNQFESSNNFAGGFCNCSNGQSEQLFPCLYCTTQRCEQAINDQFATTESFLTEQCIDPLFCDDGERFPTVRKFCDDVCLDYSHMYSCDFIWRAGLGIGIAAVLANTSMDENFDAWYQKRIQNSSTDDFSDRTRWFGNGFVVFPTVAAVAIIGSMLERRWKKLERGRCGHWASESPAGPFVRRGTDLLTDWSLRYLRASAVGVPTVIFFQWALGASRPGEKDYGSQWNPFADMNAVSGHAFIGGLLFITAAKMTNRPLMKACFYGLSAIPAWSRINDRKHYLSQVMLGWYFAYMAASAVEETEEFKQWRRWTVMPVATQETVGVELAATW